MGGFWLESSIVSHDNGSRASKAMLWVIDPSPSRTTDRTNTFKLKVSPACWERNYDYDWTVGNYIQYYNSSWNNWKSFSQVVENGVSGTTYKYWDNSASETARHDPLYISAEGTITKVRIGEAGVAQLNNWTNKIVGLEVTLAPYWKYAFKDFQVSLSHCTGSNYRVTGAINDWAGERNIAVGDIIYNGETITCDLTYDEGYTGPQTYSQTVDTTNKVFTYSASLISSKLIYTAGEHITPTVTVNGAVKASGSDIVLGDIINATWTTDTGWSGTCNHALPIVATGVEDVNLSFTASQTGGMNYYSDGAWHRAQAFYYINGAWHLCVPYMYSSSAWHQCG